MLDELCTVSRDLLILRSEQDFCLDFLGKPENKEILTQAAQTAGGQPYQIKFEKMGERLDQDDPFQELLKEI